MSERIEAIGRFAQHGEAADAGPRLENAFLTAPEPEVRLAALHGLVARGLLQPDVVLRAARGDANPDVRAEAVGVLRLLVPEDPHVQAMVGAFAETDITPACAEARPPRRGRTRWRSWPTTCGAGRRPQRLRASAMRRSTSGRRPGGFGSWRRRFGS